MAGIPPPDRRAKPPLPGPIPQPHRANLGQDAARLNQLMQPSQPARPAPDGAERAGGEPPRREPEREQKPSRSNEAMGSPGDAILAGLSQAPVSSNAAPTEEVAASSRTTTDLNELADQLADRILVGTRADGATELRVQLKTESFGQTEFSLSRVNDRIELRIETMSDQLENALRDGGQTFTDTLSARLGMPVNLDVATQSDGGMAGGQEDPNRSRGFDNIMRYAAERRD